MSNKYTVTMQLDNTQSFLHFVDNVGPLVSRLVVTVEGGHEEAVNHDVQPPKTRALRGSKVNDAILGAMKHGPRPVKELKEALETAGLSAGSLSTGIATLQRDGVIERTSEGIYGLKQAA